MNLTTLNVTTIAKERYYKGKQQTEGGNICSVYN